LFSVALEQAVESRRPIVAFVENAPKNRGFSNFELPVALEHPDTIVNGYPTRAFGSGDDALKFASNSAAEYQALERSIAEAATRNTGREVSVAEVRKSLDLADGYNATNKTVFDVPKASFEQLNFDSMKSAADDWSVVRAAARSPRVPSAIEPELRAPSLDAHPSTGPPLAGATEMPARIGNVPEVDAPKMGGAGAAVLGGAAFVAAGYDAKQTGDRMSTAYAQDNPTAAQSEATHFLARTGGGAAAGLTIYGAGVSGGPAVALAVADAYFLMEAAERGAKYLDVRKITHQTSSDGADYVFNGKQWIRDDLKADLRDDGIDQVREQTFAAQPEKARELSQLASAEAVGQAIHKAHPENPFVQPANEHDPAHLHHRDWTRSPETGAWSRSVADEVDRNDTPVWKAQPEYASPARAAELDRQAAQVIDRNLTEGPAALAARYEVAHRRNGWDSFGPEPDVVRTALNPDTLQASDQRQYVRDAQGQWSHDGEPARGNTAVELEATRERLLPALAQHQDALARIEPWQPPTPEQQDRANLRQLYSENGVNPNPERFEAAYQAVRETREAQGINPAATSLALEPRPAGSYDINTPIQHLQIEGDGVVRVAATTTAADIQRTEAALKGAPHAIEAPSARAREEQAQAQREANRAGLSQDDTQATMRSAVPTVATPGGRSGKTDDVEPAAKEEAKPERTGAMLLDNPAHQNHAMFAALLRTVNERDKELGREPDEISRQLAGGLVEKARERGLETIGAAKFTPDGTKVGMSDTADLSAPWARTAVGDVGQLAGQKLEQSSENVAAINQQQALQQSLQPPTQTQVMDGPDGPAPKGPRLA
jgi:hypothetical protein